MTELEQLIEDLQRTFGNDGTPVLSVDVDVHPARPENAGRAWIERVKNALKELSEIRDAREKETRRCMKRSYG
jgi:hypothetical protein